MGDNDLTPMLIALGVAGLLVLVFNGDWVVRLIAGRRLLPKAEKGEEILELEPDPEPGEVQRPSPYPLRAHLIAIAVVAAVAVGHIIADVWRSGGRDKLQRRIVDLEGEVDHLDSQVRRLESELSSLRYRVSDIEH